MHPYLQRLGVLPEVQSFFQPFWFPGLSDLVFNYGNTCEHYGIAFHRIPVTEELWIAGNQPTARHVFICGSAMDAIAWLHYHLANFNQTDNLLFVSVGASPCKTQIMWINEHLNNKQFHLIFSRDSLGCCCDLKIAAGLRKMPLIISASGQQLLVNFGMKDYLFDHLSLSALEKAAGFHFNIPAHKAKTANTYFEHLKHGH
ncbi:MAG TPA: hypothetical protein VFE53_24040 [Mucilaginibacter sp.]|jgi:hypothetical protein|nr:hypothetical protein [Mucilaginibacter sp.]